MGKSQGGSRECIHNNLTYTPLHFDSSPLENDGWNMIHFLLGPGNFSGALAVKFWGCNFQVFKKTFHLYAKLRTIDCRRSYRSVTVKSGPFRGPKYPKVFYMILKKPREDVMKILMNF